MKTSTSLRLSKSERAVLERVVPFLTIAYPDLPASGMELKDRRRSEEDGRRRALRSLANGEYVSRVMLERADQGLRDQLVTCVRESRPSHWEEVRRESVGDRPATAAEIQMAHVLVEARLRQAEEAREALALVAMALTIVPPEPDEEDD